MLHVIITMKGYKKIFQYFMLFFLILIITLVMYNLNILLIYFKGDMVDSVKKIDKLHNYDI